MLARETVANLAATVVHDAIARDALSLTVALRNAIDRGVIASAAVYDDAGGLLVTVGAPAREAVLFTHEIRTRDTAVGRLQITLARSAAPGFDWLFLPVAVLMLLVLGAWQWARYLPESAAGVASSESDDDEPAADDDDVPVLHEQVQLFDDHPTVTALIVKVEPPRRTDEIGTVVDGLASEHAVQLTRTGNEFCLLGDSPAIAVTIALTLDEGTPERLTLRMGMDASRTGGDETSLLKRARYLASLSNGTLLVSRSVFDGLTPGDFTVERFHSSFAQGDIYEVA